MSSHPLEIPGAPAPGVRTFGRRPACAAWAVALAMAALLLSGCTAEPAPTLSALPPVSATVGPPASPAASPSTQAPACVDGVLTLAAAEQDIAVTGSCARVDIAGAGLEIDLTRAEVSVVTVRGDRNDVDAHALESLTVEGQDNEFDLASVGTATLRGDRNSVDVEKGIDALVVAGNENEVEAAEIESADVSGDRNEVVPG